MSEDKYRVCGRNIYVSEGDELIASGYVYMFFLFLVFKHMEVVELNVSARSPVAARRSLVQG